MQFLQTLRTLAKHPGFAVPAALTLALGIGLSTAFSSGADSLLLRPLPVPESDAIVRVYTAAKFQPLGYVSYPDYVDLTRDSATLAGAVAQVQILAAAGSASEQTPRVRMGLAVTPNYFYVLRVFAQLGRTFTPADAHEGLVVLADSFWRSHYNANRSVIGQGITIAGAPYTVIGVAPRGFGLDRFLHEDFYVPVEAYAANLATGENPLHDRGRRFLSVYGRLAASDAMAKAASVAQAQAELAAHSARLADEYPDTNRGRSAVVLTERAARWRSDRNMPWIAVILLTVAALILAIACGNVSGLLLLRAEERKGEIALRAALGATPWHLFAGIQSESVPLAAAGFALGLPLAWASVRIAVRSLTLPADFAIQITPSIDARALGWAALAAAMAAIIGGCVPWLAVRRANPMEVLKTATSKMAARSRARDTLIVFQVALAAALFSGCAVMIGQLFAAQHVDLGYRTDRVLVMAFDPAQLREDEPRSRAFYKTLLDGVAQMPGIRSAALAQSVPLGMTGAQKQVRIADALEPTAVWMNTVTPGYFELMRMPLLEGRGFEVSDTAESAAVAVVNEEMAKLWPVRSSGSLAARQAALGQVMTVAGHQVHVVGVVRTAKYFDISEAPRPFFYLPFAQSYTSRMFLHVETAGAPANVAPAVVTYARFIDPRQPVSEVRALDRYFDEGALFGLRTGVRVTGAAALCALLLALAGVFVSLERTVQCSRREIGIRLALGATPSGIARYFTLRGMRLVALGATVGTALAAIGVTAPIPGVSLRTADGFPSGALVCAFASVWLVGVAACLIPALRAAAADPAVALRQN